MDAGTALVGLGGGVIALGGVYLGSQWEAQRNLAQWRRERLLEFCSDLLAAGNEIVNVGWDVKASAFPEEAKQRLDRALSGILLLSDELSNDAFEFSETVARALK